MQGASPLASPGLNGARHWFFLWKAGSGGGVCPVGRLLTLPLWYPAGGLAFFVAR